jgi:hypothetical protein
VKLKRQENKKRKRNHAKRREQPRRLSPHHEPKTPKTAENTEKLDNQTSWHKIRKKLRKQPSETTMPFSKKTVRVKNKRLKS